VGSTTCIHCGAPLTRAGVKFCTRCGKAQDVPATVPPQEQEKRSRGAEENQSTPAPLLPISSAPLPPASSSPFLVVQDEGETREVALGREPVTLGRAADNSIVLRSRFVSARHARIEPDGVAHRILDIGSTNGLLAEGRRLTLSTPLPMADGDVLRIGDPATGNFVSLTYRNSRAVRQAQAATVARSYPLDPTDTQITIGRDGCDITLENPQVSRQHAVIERHGTTHALRDLGSTNGTFVNGRRVTQHTLGVGDVIQIGAFKLVYGGDSLDEYDQRGALRIDARNLWREVGPNGRTRMILRDVSLSIAPREFVALVGGSGTGKSTLLNALSGFAPASHGGVFVNGDDYYRNFDAYRTVLGYVPQDDILHRPLPVERALGYAAELRLPADTARPEITRRISQVLDDVEMAPHRDKPVENLSGGQRKRVSIGAELLADPSLFFLDEPTSGLDPGLEKKMMYTLRRLADSGRTVVLVTHATANITQCDHVAFMSDGRMVYFGPPSEAPAFFGVGSGDFADIYTKLEGHADPQDIERWAVVQRDLKAEYEAWRKNAERGTPNAEGSESPRSSTDPKTPKPVQRSAFSVQPSLAELWEMKFRASPQHRQYVAGRLAQAPAGPVAGSVEASAAKAPRVSAPRQFVILARRYFDLLLQDRRNLSILLLQAPLIGLLLMLVAKADAIVGENAYANEAKKVLFMLATVAVWFGIINAAREIAKEAAVFRRERLANLRIVPYVLSKVVVLALLVAVQSLVLLGLVALKVQFPAQGVLLPIGPELFITTFLTALAGLAMGLAISAFASTPDRAISVVPLALIPQILFAGVIFSLGDGITAQRVLSWFTVSRWAMDAYGTSVNLNDLPLAPGMLRLPNPPAEYTYTPEHLLSRWIILGGYAIACLVVAGWLLRMKNAK
jgi:ABC transport system ATP-binding/permease protein